MKVCYSLFLVCLVSLTSVAQTAPGNCTSFKKNGSQFIFDCSNGGKVLVQLCSRSVVKVWYEPSGNFARSNPSFAVVDENFEDMSNAHVDDQAQAYEIFTGTLRIRVNKTPFNLQIFDKYQKLLMGDYQDRGHVGDSSAVAAYKVLRPDEQFFGGSTNDLLKARVNEIPILRKDFIVDEYQVTEAKAMGADVILLIAACLTPAEVKRLATFAKSLGLEVLLELHAEEELEHICEETEIVGINNRNLKTFEVDIERSLRMAKQIPANKIKVAESGISSVENILLFKANGFRGFLIGENFMKEENPGKAFEQFTQQLKKQKHEY